MCIRDRAGRIIKLANYINPNKNRPIASVTVDTLILIGIQAVSYTHLRAHETVLDLVCRLLLEKKKK